MNTESAGINGLSRAESYLVAGGALHRLFEGVVDRFGTRVACRADGQDTTYDGLDRRANKLAHRLRRLGVGRGSRVAIHLERSAEMVVSIIAVLKAGGAYVPLDPEHPTERRIFMIMDSGAEVLISRSSLWDATILPQAVKLLCLDTTPLNQEPEARLAEDGAPDALAYVIYTSGSTGAPKGVMVTHHNVTRLFRTTESWFGFSADDVWTLFHSFAFDFSVWEMWGALLYGGKLIVVPFSVSRTPREMAQLLAAEGITVLCQTPSAFRALAPAVLAANAPPLRYVIFGGEELAFRSLQAWFERFGDEKPRCINMYGITETTVHATYRPITLADAASEQRSCIGIPLPDLELLLWDSHGAEVSAGQVGEIIVAGDGVTLGYLGHPELTRERFIERNGGRYYRSGDLARRLPDGGLEFLGRADGQVKLRGFRIETGEIAARIVAQGGVAEAIVRVWGTGDQALLVAYCVPKAGAQIELRALRDYLQRFLPAYMLPSSFIELAQLPLTSNGKLDLAALPAPDPDSVHYRAPHSETERLLAAIWGEVLDVSRGVGLDDDFIALGGNSIAAARVRQRIYEARSVWVSFRELLGTSRLEELARTIESHEKQDLSAEPSLRSIGAAPQLTFAEEQFLLTSQLALNQPLYSESLIIRVGSTLDHARLERAFAALAQRHVVLRSNYRLDEGDARRVVMRTPALPVYQHDLRALPTEQQPAEFARMATVRVRQGFDLASEPLLRVDLYTLADRDHRLLLSFHHIIMDGAACAVLLRELATLYAQEDADLPPVQYDLPAVAAWQRQQLDLLQRNHLPYWREHLADLTDLALPTDHPRAALRSFRGARLRRTLSPELAVRLRGLAGARGTTLFTTLLSAFLILLHRHTGQTDIAIGTISAGRQAPETAAVVGCLINPIVIRQDVNPTQSFESLLASVRETLLAAQAHDGLPFATLVRELGAAGSAARNPLFPICFSANVPIAAPLPDWTVEIGPLDSGTARFDLAVQVDERADGIDLYFEYALDLFEAATLERLADRFATLLEAVTTDAAAPVCSFALMGAHEKQTLARWSWGGPPLDEELILDMIRRQVALRPQATAAIFEDSRLSYLELDQRSDDLAAQLVECGVQSEQIVGLSTPSSLEWLIGMLGIWKAGAAFLPLDPRYPKARLDTMLVDARVKLLCTTSGLRELFKDFSGSMIDLASCRRRPAPCGRPLPALSKNSLAYVIYTSGSTGLPKGALIEHGGLANVVQASLRVLKLTESDRMAQFSSPCFDACILEAFPVLAAGGTLVIAPPAARLPGQEMVRFLSQHSVTAMVCVPSSLAALPDAPLAALRLICCVGDKLGAELVQRWGAGRTLFNMYGPTETTVIITAAQCPMGAGKPPIGRVLDGTQVYVVDERMRPVPLGVPGELLIGGRGVGRGYLHRPELTAERFVSDPVSPERGRVYRTGDLVRFRNDGQLEFLSRIDRQVKLRGFRIELSEIETALLRHPGVAQTVVVLREDLPGEPRLIAYIVPREGGNLASELRTHLVSKLPDFMIPAAFVELPALPLSSTGKVDPRALPAPDFSQQPKTLLASPTEEAVAQVWREVLRLDEVGPEEPFFEVGGDSLSLARVQALLRRKLQVDVEMIALLRFPTVRALAAHLATHAATPVAPSQDSTTKERDAVAIIGMAFRGPGVRSIDELWPLLAAGRDAIARWTPPADKKRPPNFIPAEGLLDEADAFDAEFFGITAAEAALMDPQHRVFLEAAWAALEDAGYDPRRFPGRIGVFAGAGAPRHWLGPVSAALAGESTGTLADRAELGNAPEFLTSRAAHKLKLRGPAVTVHTACSTSLAAVHLARQALLAKECELAIAGGVSIASLGPDEQGYVAAEGGIFSRDGHCRPFDRAASGTVKASGVALVVLRRLSDAEPAGDAVRAVILGSAMNNDGGDKIGFSAPSEQGQVEVLEQAYAAAQINPATIAFVQAHGTGTALGDAIEVAALKRLVADKKAGAPISLTSVKANLGHLDAAAGATGLIAAVLALQHRTVPGMPGVQAASPLLHLAGSPFVVHGDARRLPGRAPGDAPICAGVSALGMGGTNVHVVLREAEQGRAGSESSRRAAALFCLSARSRAALDRMTDGLKKRLQKSHPVERDGVAYTLAVGRAAFAYRRTLVLSREEDAGNAGEVAERWHTGQAAGSPPLVFLFPGQGPQVVNMGRALYREYPRFRAEVDGALTLLRQDAGLDLRPYLLAGDDSQKSQLAEASLAQPAMFIISYALAQLLGSWGLAPSALFGHSLGEYTAACLAGVFSLRDALRLLRERGRLMDSLAPGGMTSVFAKRSEVEQHLPPGLAIATEAPACTVISGPLPLLDRAEQILTRRGREWARLPLTRAYHSPAMEDIRKPLAECIASLMLRPPSIPLVSCITGNWLAAQEAQSAAYWADHLCRTVLLERGLQTLLADPARIFVEVGPGRSMLGFLRRHAGANQATVAVSTLPRPGEEQEPALLLEALGRLWTKGAEVDWAAFFADQPPRRVSLPTYPFERRRFPIERVGSAGLGRSRTESEAPPAEPGPARSPFHLSAELAGLTARVQEMAAQGKLQPLAERPGVRDQLNALCTALIRRYFAQAAQLKPGQSLPRSELRARLRLLPKFEPMLDYLLHTVHRHRLAVVSADQVRWLEEPSPDALRSSLLREHPELAGLVRYLEHCVAAYPNALTGQIEPVGVLYPDGTDAFYRQCLQGEEPGCLQLGRDIATDFVRRLGRTAKIVEVGAGHGQLTWPLVESLRKENIEYSFTDIGRSFLVRAAAVAAERGLPWLSAGRLDLNSPPEAQGYARGSFDLVLGYNAVHTARDTERTLGWLRDLLSPSGLLLLVETTRAELWDHLIWGLAPGFWDATSRSSGCLLHGAEDWGSLARRTGFASFTVLPEDGAQHDHAILVAQQDKPAAFLRKSTAPVPERTAAQEPLFQIWQRLLGVERVDRRASFFDLGGDSLLAVQLLAEVRLRLGVEIKMPQFAQAPTLEGLLRLLPQAAASPVLPAATLGPAQRPADKPALPSCIVPLQAKGKKSPFFCVHGMGGSAAPFAALAPTPSSPESSRSRRSSVSSPSAVTPRQPSTAR